MKVRELGRFIRDQRSSARLSLRHLSKLTGVSNPYLSQIERGLRRPSADILQAIAKALRISAETLYVKAGILDERADADPIGEIRRDATITEKQKQILLDLYQSFRESGSDADAIRRAAERARTQRPARRTRVAATVSRRKLASQGAAGPKKKSEPKKGATPRKKARVSGTATPVRAAKAVRRRAR